MKEIKNCFLLLLFQEKWKKEEPTTTTNQMKNTSAQHFNICRILPIHSKRSFEYLLCSSYISICLMKIQIEGFRVAFHTLLYFVALYHFKIN